MSMQHVLANDFLATPYDECNVFQSRSTELVVCSLTAGEFVTIAWFFPFTLCFCQTNVHFAGRLNMVVELCLMGSSHGSVVVAFIGLAFAA
jgi:hypothetical protein